MLYIILHTGSLTIRLPLVLESFDLILLRSLLDVFSELIYLYLIVIDLLSILKFHLFELLVLLMAPLCLRCGAKSWWVINQGKLLVAINL